MSTHTPHDALFRHVFSRKENAAGELRAVLPAALATRIDWSSLRLDEGRFVDPELAERQSDLLFAANIAGHEALVYLLLDHQSSVDSLMPLRLLRYMLRIWDRWLSDHPDAKRIPVIVPVVLYHGEPGAERWAGPRTMHALFDVDGPVLDLVRPLVPGFELLLDEIGSEPDEALRARAMQTLGLLALLLLKHARHADDLLERLVGWAGMLRELLEAPDGREALGLIVRYALLVSKQLTIGAIDATLGPAVGEPLREVVMTEGERLIALGEARGKAEGKVEGKAEGRAEGKAEGIAHAVLAVLQARGIAVSETARSRILSCTDVAVLDGWIVRAATASSAAEIVSEG